MAEKEQDIYRDTNSTMFCKCQCGRPFELFCENHNEIMCDRCRTTTHLKCQTESVGKRCKKYNPKNIKTTLKMADDWKDKIGALKQSAHSRLGELSDLKEKCKNDIKRFRQELESSLDNIEKNTIEDLERHFYNIHGLVENHLTTLTSLCNELDKDNSILQAAKKDGRKEILFSTDVLVSKHLQNYESTYENVLSGVKEVALTFVQNDEFDIIQNMKALGNIYTNDNQLHHQSSGPVSNTRTNSLSRNVVEDQETKQRKKSQTSCDDPLKSIKEQLQKELERQSRELQEELVKTQSDQIREHQQQKDQMRRDTVKKEKEHLERVQKQKQDSERERKRKEQIRQEQLRKEQEKQDEIRERIERDRKSRQSQLQEMLLNTNQQEENRQELIRQQHLRTEQSRQEQMKEQERLAQIRQAQQEELNQKHTHQNEIRQQQIQEELKRQKEVQENQQRCRQENLKQTQEEQMKQERKRQEQLQQEQIRRAKIKHEKIQEQKKEEEMRRAREEMIRQERAQREELRQEQLRQEQKKIEQLQEQQRQMKEEQIRQMKEEEERQKQLLKMLYQNIK